MRNRPPGHNWGTWTPLPDEVPRPESGIDVDSPYGRWLQDQYEDGVECRRKGLHGHNSNPAAENGFVDQDRVAQKHGYE